MDGITDYLTSLRSLSTRFLLRGGFAQQLSNYSILLIINGILYEFMGVFVTFGLCATSSAYTISLAIVIHLGGKLPQTLSFIVADVCLFGFFVLVVFLTFASKCDKVSGVILHRFVASVGELERTKVRRSVKTRQIRALRRITISMGVNGYTAFAITAENLLITMKLLIDISINFVVFFK